VWIRIADDLRQAVAQFEDYEVCMLIIIHGSADFEYAVECGWVKDEQSLNHWLISLLFSSYGELEIPLLKRFYDACIDEDLERISYWIDFLVSCQETNELRVEEMNRGRAMTKLLSETVSYRNKRYRSGRG